MQHYPIEELLRFYFGQLPRRLRLAELDLDEQRRQLEKLGGEELLYDSGGEVMRYAPSTGISGRPSDTTQRKALAEEPKKLREERARLLHNTQELEQEIAEYNLIQRSVDTALSLIDSHIKEVVIWRYKDGQGFSKMDTPYERHALSRMFTETMHRLCRFLAPRITEQTIPWNARYNADILLTTPPQRPNTRAENYEATGNYHA